ncbi:tRNA pseudouridine(38-40) synthase TruA [Rickettsiales bacterium LUAb2]
MPRYKLTIEYDGTKFFGYQKQKNQVTIQQTLETAIAKLANNEPAIFGAGRTDTGVHASGQVVHFDMDRELEGNRLQLALNFHLQSDFISVITAENLGNTSDFHARFSAKERWYDYKIIEQPNPPTFNRHLYWWFRKCLNHEAMHDAAQILVGKHDFTTFRSKGCASTSPIKTINEITITRNNNIINIRIKAPSFLYHQVRNIVGTLILVGLDKWHKQDLQSALAAKNPKYRGAQAEPQGLYLIKIVY